jgi:8-oxo-dGTP pyrophosphatase MutT (NUDIX family)
MREFIKIVEALSHDEQEAVHKAELEKTGFWGAKGAGCIFLAQSTGRILLCHRSQDVEQPNSWGGWGGAIDQGETPEEAVQREAREETGHPGPFEMIPLYVFKSNSFRYYNYVVIVSEEFDPHETWESQGHEWVKFGHWPHPLHFGLVALFNDGPSVSLLQKLIAHSGRQRLGNDRSKVQDRNLPGDD